MTVWHKAIPPPFPSSLEKKTRVNVNKSELLTRAESGRDRCQDDTGDLRGTYASRSGVPFQDGHPGGVKPVGPPGGGVSAKAELTPAASGQTGALCVSISEISA